MDVVVPVVFPDYLIAVNTPDYTVDLPGDWLDFTIPKTKNKVPELGHAGVFFARGSDGLTKYYEYGRYDRAGLGLVRKISIPDAKSKDGKIDVDSLKPIFKRISLKAGQGGRMQGAYIEVESKFKDMLKYAQARRAQNSNPKRTPYDLLTNSCIHFAKDVVKAAGVSTPWMIDPRPNSYIGEFRDDFLDLDYTRKGNKLVIGD
ncbi:MAG: hypothetical protein AAGF45_09165 [Pseudomonadota bacterium]